MHLLLFYSFKFDFVNFCLLESDSSTNAWKYTPASVASHSSTQHFWNYIGRNFIDRGNPKKSIEFTIIDVCTCNKFEGLFFKYVELERFSSYLKRSDEQMCDYST